MLKRNKTQKDRTGYEFSGQNPELLLKAHNTYKEKTGYECPFQNPEVIEKISNDCERKTGYSWYMKIPEIKEKAKLNRIASLKNMKVPYSKISQELFWEIYLKLPSELKESTHFAELSGGELARYDSTNRTAYFYDFVITSIQVVIEFDGYYWHSMEGVEARDEQKQKFIEDLGFKVIRVIDKDYLSNKENILNLCLSSIYEIYKGNKTNKQKPIDVN
jgi:very-short-patch-repair endonuclease